MARKGRSKEKAATIDPTLVRQLANAPAESNVQAVFTLKTPAGEPYRSATSARDTMGKIVKEASAGANAQPHRVTMFPNVQSFAVSGPPALVRRLAEHGDIASAMANVQGEDMLIRPVKSSRVAKKKR
jgi:hypothetical protein